MAGDDTTYHCTMVGGKGVGHNVLASIECLNVKRKHWSSLPEMPKAVFAPAVVTYSNKIFVFGGRYAQNKDLCSTHVFDTTRGQWSNLSDMSQVCSIGAAITMNDCIYVVGGYDRTSLKYDPATDSWTMLVAGGGGPKPESSVIEQYNPLTDTWFDWTTTLHMKMTAHGMLNVDLYGIV